MDASRNRAAAGVSLVASGTVTVLGFVTAATQYPGYSPTEQTISALGSAGAPPGSQALFNGAMVLAGLLLFAGAVALYRVGDRPLLVGLVAVTGVVGLAGVGLFPSQTGALHTVAAMAAFGGAGLTALVVAGTVAGPFRYVSAVLGGFELVALALFVVLAGDNPLGVGGLERWVAYLGLAWVLAFGGFLLPGDLDRG
ncbi:MAG: DUF998 domain-containing protein [Halanaeroarchaeum sp.]